MAYGYRYSKDMIINWYMYVTLGWAWNSAQLLIRSTLNLEQFMDFRTWNRITDKKILGRMRKIKKLSKTNIDIEVSVRDSTDMTNHESRTGRSLPGSRPTLATEWSVARRTDLPRSASSSFIPSASPSRSPRTTPSSWSLANAAWLLSGVCVASFLPFFFISSIQIHQMRYKVES